MTSTEILNRLTRDYRAFFPQSKLCTSIVPMYMKPLGRRHPYLFEVVDVSQLNVGDVPVPQVVDDLGEVDRLSERPGNVLAHSGRCLEPLSLIHI